MLNEVSETALSAGRGPHAEVTLVLGESAFLVPCAPGTRTPIVTYRDRPFEATQMEAYRALFDVSPVNVAVYLGKASGGLCAIDFDRDEDLETFIGVNPKLGPSLRSCAWRGAQIWIRIEGEYPRSCKAPNFEWRADGNLSTIHGQHEKGVEYRLLCRNPPVALKFEDGARDNSIEQLKDFETPVPSVPREERLPDGLADGTLVIPFDSPQRFHWWSGGQTLRETRDEIERAKG